jgi:DNA-binding transcriptional regulator YiaG
MYRFTDGGLSNIWLANGYEIHETAYSKAVSFHDLDGLTRAICIALVERQAPINGDEFRYLRQALCLSQVALGQLMGKTDQAVAKWEKSGEPIPKLADFAMRALYRLHANHDDTIRNLVTALNITERTLHIVMRETAKGWQHVEQEEIPEQTPA